MKITTETIKNIIGIESISNSDLIQINLIKRIIETKQGEMDSQLKSEIEIATKKFNDAKAKAEEKILTKAVQETIKFLNLNFEKVDSNTDEVSQENYHQNNNYSGGYQS